MFVSNDTSEGGFTSEWQRVVDSMNLVAKQWQFIRGLEVATRMEVIP